MLRRKKAGNAEAPICGTGLKLFGVERLRVTIPCAVLGKDALESYFQSRVPKLAWISGGGTVSTPVKVEQRFPPQSGIPHSSV